MTREIEDLCQTGMYEDFGESGARSQTQWLSVSGFAECFALFCPGWEKLPEQTCPTQRMRLASQASSWSKMVSGDGN